MAAPRENEEDGDEEKSSLDLISTLPRDNRWTSICQYRKFWLPDFRLPGMLAARRCLVTRPDDIFLASFPKSGSTWLKALVFSLTHRSRHHPADPCHPLRTANPHDCVLFMDEVFTVDPHPDLDALPSPRIWSLHTPGSLLPASVRDCSCRIVYVTRDPKDVFVSLFYFRNSVDYFARTPLTMAEAFETFCSGTCPYGPIWEHALEYWNESVRQPGKVLFLHYEQMMGDPTGTLRRLADFLGYPFSEEEEREGIVEAITELCSFQGLSSVAVNREGVLKTFKTISFRTNTFFRRGKVGDWRNHLNPEMAERLDVITEEKLRGTGLKLS